MEQSTPGQRVRDARRRAGLNQVDFGSRMGRSQAWVSDIERGVLELDSIALMNQAAKVLNVHPNEISGRPYRGSTPSEDQGHLAISEIRRQIERFDLDPEWTDPIASLPDLKRKTADATTLRLNARYVKLAEQLPLLLAELQAATREWQGRDRDEAFRLLGIAYREADAVAYGLGYHDLSVLATRNLRWAAEQSGSACLMAVAGYLRVREFWSSASWGDALTVLDRTTDLVQDGYTAGDPWAVSITGSLQMRAAVTAARRGDAAEADARIEAARQAAERLTNTTGAFNRLVFPPTEGNVAIHGVTVAVELQDGVKAVQLSRGVQIPAGAERNQVAHYLLDLARGWHWYGDQERALATLERAERRAPMIIRNHPMARALIRQLLARDRRRNDRLRRIATRMRVTQTEG